MNKALFTCKNCGEKFYKKDAIKVKRGYKQIYFCPKCNSSRLIGVMPLNIGDEKTFGVVVSASLNTNDFDNKITLEPEPEPVTKFKLEPKFKVGDIIAKAHLRFRIVKVECDRYIVEGTPGINLVVLFKDQDEYRLIKEEKITTVEKAVEVFAEMLVELCPKLFGFGEVAKEWENKFRKRLEE